jgi:phytanoyl-CoA hydroxylase
LEALEILEAARGVDPRSHPPVHPVNGSTPAASEGRARLDFDSDTLPWIDRDDADIDRYVEGLSALPPTKRAHLRERLHDWRRDGYLILEQAIDHQLIDAYLSDLDELLSERNDSAALVNGPGHGVVPIRELSPEQLHQPQLRILDFHNASTAGKRIGLATPLVDLLEHLLGDTVVAMQSLTFTRGSQQATHQDFAYVIAGIPSHLAAAWIALEDIHPDAGPVGYYRGSHRLPKFDFGNGLFLTEESTKREPEFSQYLDRESRARDLPFKELVVKKGDVLIWHCSLAHCGTPVRNDDLTRKSVVFHYSTPQAYPRDRRVPDEEPTPCALNGAICYEDTLRPELEDSFLASGELKK